MSEKAVGIGILQEFLYFIFLANEGGVCAKFHELFIDAEDPNLSQWESRNTGIVNFAYHLKALPTTVSKLAFAHEIGHSFGSPVSFTKI